MASQSSMFEIASGSGSTSSDSFINISPSGASSISTSTSTTNNTAINEEKLKTEIYRLREDNKNLEGRIRGYKTLSGLLVDCRRENELLKAQLKAVNASPQIMPSTGDHQASLKSPFSLVYMQAAQNQTSGTVSQPDMTQQTHHEQNGSSLNPLTRSTASVDAKGPPVSYPPVSGPPTSLQETVCPPGDLKEIKLIPLPSDTGADDKPASGPQESIPKQESLEPETGAHPNQSDSSPASQINHPESLASENSSPELLQPDSDKYDEATYEKVGLQLGRGHAGLTSSMFAAGTSREESRPPDFPSLSSETSTGMAQPPSQNSSSNPPFMAMMHQSLRGLTLNKPSSDLATEMENITERLNSEPVDSMPAIAHQIHEIAERISKKEQKERDQKTLIETLMRENHDLKRMVKVNENAYRSEIVALREQNTRMMQQLKGQRQDEQNTAVKSSGSHGDWVHVERPKQLGEGLGDSDHSLVDRVRTLEQEKAELLRANSNWKSRWDQMEHNHQVKVSEMRSKQLLNDQELSALKVRLAEQTSDFEGRMLEMKRRIGEEENMKEEAQHHLRLAERRCSELQDQLTEIRTQLSDTAREKQALSAELGFLKSHSTGQEMQTSSAASRTALEAEIAMLKEQLKVFAEDFEQERVDRTTAQAARDSAKKSAETIARQNQSLSSQVKHLQKQIKDRDDTISWTLRQNETLQRQASDYKKKLASEWEEKQTLQRRLLSLEQQLQHQPMRNPYLTETTPYNPGPVHQPPSPLRATPSYFGSQGGVAALPTRNRTIPGIVSPEHLPGAWTCSACTYINYPGRTVCESCGFVNSPRTHPDQFAFTSHDMYSSENAQLMSRGQDQSQGGMMPGNGDLVADSGPRVSTPN